MSRLAVNFGFFSILAGTQKIFLQSREHRGPNLILMSLKDRLIVPASRFSITPLNSGPKWTKNAKIQKIRYKSVINQKSVVKLFEKFLKYPSHVLRSVCHLQVDEGMLRSCFTFD